MHGERDRHRARAREVRRNWYKVGVELHRIDELREYVRETARSFGQKCLYFERAGEAEFVWAQAHQLKP